MLPDNYHRLDMLSRRDWMYDKLVNGIFIIEFTKVNGEIRRMPCTLKHDIAPKIVNESGKKRVTNPEILSVWCVDKNEWRSFKLANVIKMELYNE